MKRSQKHIMKILIIQVNILKLIFTNHLIEFSDTQEFEWMNRLLLYCIAIINRSTHLLNHIINEKIDIVNYQWSLYNYILTIYK